MVAAGISFQTANASEGSPAPEAKTLSAPAAGKLASTLVGELGGAAAGSYYDAETKALVVNVVGAKAAETVREAGARAKVVTYSLAELKDARGSLTGKASTPGTAVAVDPVSNKVVVTADSTVKGAALDRLTKTVAKLGDKAELKKTSGEFTKFIAGGEAIHSGGGRCSLGFNVTVGGAPHFITAGHCGTAGSSWSDSAGGAEVGSMVDSQFPGNDFALVEYTGAADAPSAVDLYDGTTQEITEAGDATVGQTVSRSGSTTQVHDGEVTALDATVDYGGGDVVEGLIQTTVCAEPGDSGGSLFSGTTALGLTSGGSGDCTSGGETFFQPVPEALSAFGAQIG